MNRPDFSQLIVYVEGLDREMPIGDALDEAHAALIEGRVEQAASFYLDIASALLDSGNVIAAQEQLNQLGGEIDTDELSRETQARMLFIQGGALSRVGRRDAARDAYHRMKVIGEELSNRQIVALADYNIANQAFYEGDIEQARLLYKSAFVGFNDLGDHYGAVRTLLSVAFIDQARGELTQAENILATADELLELAQGPYDLRFTWALASGQLSAKRGEAVIAVDFFRSALKSARRSGNVVAESVAMQNIGTAYVELGEYGRALRWFRRGLRLAESVHAIPEVALLHHSVATALLNTKRYREAEEHLTLASTLYKQVGDYRGGARVDADFGTLRAQQGDIDEGRQFIEQAISIFSQIGDRESEIRYLQNLLVFDRKSSDPATIEARAREILDKLPPQENRVHAEVLTLAAEAWLHARPPGIERAKELFELSLVDRNYEIALVAPTGEIAVAAQAFEAATKLAGVGGFEESLDFYTRALAVYEAKREHEMAFRVRNDRAIVLTNLERFIEAREEYEASLEVASSLDNREMQLQASFNLGEMAHREGAHDEAIHRLTQALHLAQELDDQEMELSAHASLGIALLKVERWDEAREMFTALRESAKSLGSQSAEAHAVGGIAGVEFAAGRYRTAARLYKQAVDLFFRLGDWQHAAEDLRGRLQSLAALGRKVDFERDAQRLVDLVQDTGFGRNAPDAFAWSGLDWLRRGDIKTAAECYAIAIALSGTIYKGNDEAFFEAIVKLIAMAQQQVRMEHLVDLDTFFSALQMSLNELEEGLGESLAQPFLEIRNSLNKPPSVETAGEGE